MTQWIRPLGQDKEVLPVMDPRYYMTAYITRGQHQTRTQHSHNILIICGVLCAKVVGATSSERLPVEQYDVHWTFIDELSRLVQRIRLWRSSVLYSQSYTGCSCPNFIRKCLGNAL